MLATFRPPALWRLLGLAALTGLSLIYLYVWLGMIGDPHRRTSADFIAFYSVGRIAAGPGMSSAYDLALQHSYEEAVVGVSVPTDHVLLYNHVPYLLPLLQLVALPSYATSFVIWTLVSLGIYIIASLLFLRALRLNTGRATQVLVALGTLSFFPFFMNLYLGQDTAFLFLGAVLWCCGILDEKAWLAGLGLALTTIRPEIALFLAVPFAFTRRKVLWWFCGFAGTLGLISFLLIGTQGTADFFNLLTTSASGEWFGLKEAEMVNFLGLMSRLLPSLGAGLIRGLGWALYLMTMVPMSLIWYRRRLSDDRLLGLSILAALIVDPHLHYHGLTLLILPLLFVVRDGIISRHQPGWALVPLGLSCILLLSIGLRPLYLDLPYLLSIALAWLLFRPRERAGTGTAELNP